MRLEAADSFHVTFVTVGRSATLWMLIGFVVAFATTRGITLRIRARNLRASDGSHGGGMVKDVHIGGVHVHHQVWGILLIMVTGLLEFRYAPGSPGREILAALFGVGAALSLDEFALWLHLDDVYWSEEGRKSIDAVMVAIVVGIGLLTGSAPLGLDNGNRPLDLWFVASAVIVHVGYTIICLLKGKVSSGLIGLVITVVSFVGAVRLAKPNSFWALRFYGPEKIARAEVRRVRDDRRRESLRRRFGAGAPDPDP